MILKVASEDRQLRRLCSEVLDGLATDGWIISSPDQESGVQADLTVWDFSPSMQFPEDVFRESRRNLYIVDRKDLNTFQARAGAADTLVLLKPVTRPTLYAFLGYAAAAAASRSRASQVHRSGRDEMLKGLIQTNLKLQEYEQDRTRYLARTVHDFRTPLLSLCGYCNLLLNEQVGSLDRRQAEVLQRMLNSTRRLSRMASEMFQLSAFRRKDTKPMLEMGDIHGCVHQGLHEIAPFAADKEIEISSLLSPVGGKLYFEPAQIERVVLNLLENACRFTPVRGSIRLRGYSYFWERRAQRTQAEVAVNRRRANRHDPNAYRIDICDSGEPIPVEHISTLFEEYTSYGGGSDRYGGGLGLAICRDIMQRHEGGVWMSNTDSGPLFSFVLPFRTAEALPSAKSKSLGNSRHKNIAACY